jgi:hypothetical protein
VIVRLFFFLLVFANLVFFAWAQGYFGATDDDREPQRLASQLNADKLRVVRGAPAPAAKQPAPACRLILGLNPADAATLKAAVEAVAGEAKILPQEPVPHRVLIGELANQAAADKKSAELTRFGVTQQEFVALEGGRFEIVLGSFGTDAEAREFLQGLMKRGIKSARVDARDQAMTKTGVEARAPEATLLQQLPKLIAPYAEATIGECAPPARQ